MTHSCKNITYDTNTNEWKLGKISINYCPFCGKDLLRVTCKNCVNYDFDDDTVENKHPKSGVWKHKCKAGMKDRYSYSSRCKLCFISNNKM